MTKFRERKKAQLRKKKRGTSTFGSEEREPPLVLALPRKGSAGGRKTLRTNLVKRGAGEQKERATDCFSQKEKKKDGPMPY